MSAEHLGAAEPTEDEVALFFRPRLAGHTRPPIPGHLLPAWLQRAECGVLGEP